MSTWENVRTKIPAKATDDVYQSLVDAWTRRGTHFVGDRESFCFAFGCGFVALTNSIALRSEWLAARSRFLSEDEHEPQ